MPKSKSEKIRFEVLKILKETSTHGYDLYLLLQEKGIISKETQPSQLYKVLRDMRESNFIKDLEIEESSKGPDRVILGLTDEGVGEYYTRIIDSAMDFYNLLVEFNIKLFSRKIRNFLKQNGYGSEYFKNKVIFFENIIPFIQKTNEIIRNLFIPLDCEFTLYLRSKSSNNTYQSLERTKINLKLLDENLSFKANSIDMSIIFGNITKGNLRKKIKEISKSLKKNGVLILFFGERVREERPEMLRDFFKDLLEEMPKEFKDNIYKIFPFSHDQQDILKSLNKQEIIKILEDNFLDILRRDIDRFVTIYICKRPKES
jgi:DNA-binding PadR family transcriptional regulator